MWVQPLWIQTHSCGPLIAAVELFTAHVYILQIWFPTFKILFSPQAKPGILSQGWHFQFLRDLHVSSVFGSNRRSWFYCQLSLSKLWASEKASWELQLNMRAEAQQSDQEVLHKYSSEQSISCGQTHVAATSALIDGKQIWREDSLHLKPVHSSLV